MKIQRFAFVAAVLVLFGYPAFGAQEPASAPAEISAVSSSSEEPGVVQGVVWLDDVLPAGAKTDGDWLWDSSTKASGEKSHGHASAKGLQSHGFTAEAVVLPANGMIVQKVWLDPQDPPRGIMLKFKLASGEEVGVYWEGEEEVFAPKEEEQIWYYGFLPELGKWKPLEILSEDLGLEGEKLTGVKFITFDGRALWDKTEIAQAPPVSDIESAGDASREKEASAPIE